MSGVSPEQQEIRALAREFAAAELRPHVERWDHDAAFDEAVLPQLGELGFFGMVAPESDGGMALDAGSWLAALEELAWGEASLALAIAFHAQVVRLVAEHGSEGVRRQWLERLAAGDALGCLALAEDEAGAHLEGTATTARRDDAAWVLSGTKRWVSNARAGGAMVVLARASEGPTLFLVPVDATGVTHGARDATLGLRPLDVRTIELHDVRVEDSARLGDAGAALAVLADAAPPAAQAIAAVGVGVAQSALDHARGYADVREQFGQKLRRFEGLQFKLADMAVRTRAARALLQDAVASGDPAVARMAKVFAAEAALYVATDAVQVYGGYGYMRDYPVEKLMRDARALSLLGGPDDGHRVAIAESLYQD